MLRLLTASLLVLLFFSFWAPAPAVHRADKTVNILLLSDIHLFSQADQSPKITRNSDTGKDLWDSAMKKIEAVLAGEAGDPPKFIIYLGDLPWHAKDSTQEPAAMKDAGKVLADLRMMATKAGIPLIFVPGNNDSPKGDYGPFSTAIFAEDQKRDGGGRGQWPVIGGRLQDTSILETGSYTVNPLPWLTVIVLNTNIFTPRYGRENGKIEQVLDGRLTLGFLARSLQKATGEGKRVLLAMHVPPGKDGYLPPQQGRDICPGHFKDLWDTAAVFGSPDGSTESAQDGFLDIVDSFSQVIVGIVGSHTHMDGVRLLENRKGAISALLVSVPGITPGHGNNPAFKVLNIDDPGGGFNSFTTIYENFFYDQQVNHWNNWSYTPLKGIEAMDPLLLRDLDNTIYTAHHGDGRSMGNCVDTTLYVHYQH